MGIVDDLERARTAFERRDWAVAYDRFASADGSPDAALGPDELLTMGTAAFLLGDTDACIRALQRGYRRQLDGGEVLGAVRFAFWLAFVLIVRGEGSIANGWAARAHRLMADQPDDVLERGYLLVHDFFRHLHSGDFQGAFAISEEMNDIARRHDNADLLSQSLACKGRLLMHSGQVPEGLALLDEAMVGVAAGELSPIFAGTVYCTMIEACQEVLDFQRASAWTTALTRWCESQPDLVPFTGQSAVHRGQILRLHAAYPEALAEFEAACNRYAKSGPQIAAGLALSERGDVLRIRGDFAAAESSYDAADGYGYEPQPGRALLMAARGRVPGAVAVVRRLLAEDLDPVQRARLLAGAVEVLLAGGALDEASGVADELATIADGFGSAGLRAAAAYCLALVALERGDPDRALPEARAALQLWAEVGAPYEAARAKVQVGRSFRLLGDEDSATAELTAAHRTFAELGVVPARLEAEKLLHHGSAGGLTGRELEVLRLVAAGNSNTEIAQRLVLSDKTVARHLTNIFGKLDVPSRTAAAAYARDHDLL